MMQAKTGDTVQVHYIGRLEDGTVFDSSRDRQPLEFTIGTGQLIPGFEQAVVGMEPGQTKEQKIPSDEAYGPRRDEMVVEVSRETLPEDLQPEVGQWLQMAFPDGSRAPVQVADVADGTVTLDANHPLAGKDLTFEIELVEIE